MSTISDKAIEFVKKSKKLFVNKFASLDIYSPVKDPITFFMAGSPGAGKTEYSKGFIENIETEEKGARIVRIDPDETRKIIPGYTGANAWEIQAAASLAIEPILDHVLHNNLNFVLDGTFSNYVKSKSNIERCIKHSRRVGIYYIYLKPEVAWAFTMQREKLDGRRILLETFIEDFFLAKDSVQKIKDEYGDKVHLYLILKDDAGTVKKTLFEVVKIDSYIDKKYNNKDLEELLKKVQI
ncbi:zeta toxin family protein [Patescibacteria group bacterium]|nr:zeta toxin family protein [Patescibacteria group bacterium]